MDPEQLGGVDSPTPAPTGVAAGSPASPTPSPTPTPGSPAPAGAPSGDPAAPPAETVPKARFFEVNRQNQELRRRIQALEQQHAPKPAAEPVNPEDDAIRKQLFKLVPSLEKFGSLTPDQVQKLLDSVPFVEQHTQQYWNTVAGGAVRQLTAVFAKTYGAQPSERQVETMRQMLHAHISRDEAAQARYMAQDPTLVDEFWKEYEESFITPIRRTTLAAEEQRAARRANLPAAPTRTHAFGKGAPPKQNMTQDERGDAAWEAIQAAR